MAIRPQTFPWPRILLLIESQSNGTVKGNGSTCKGCFPHSMPSRQDIVCPLDQGALARCKGRNEKRKNSHGCGATRNDEIYCAISSRQATKAAECQDSCTAAFKGGAKDSVGAQSCKRQENIEHILLIYDHELFDYLYYYNC